MSKLQNREKLAKLIFIKNQIEHMPNNIKRAEYIREYSRLCNYYKDIFRMNPSDRKVFYLSEDVVSKFDEYVIKKTKEKLVELSKLAPFLYSIFDELINTYKENGFCSYDYTAFHKVNSDEMYEHIEDFVNILGSDVIDLHNNMALSDHIKFLNNMDNLGTSMDGSNVDTSCMIIQNIEKQFEFYPSFVHELGHCYQYYLQRNHAHFESFNPLTEVTSILFEKLFIEFLKTKKKYYKQIYAYDLTDNIYYLNDLSASKLLCDLIMNGNIVYISPYNLKYESNIPIEVLRDKMREDCGYIMHNKMDISLTDFHYSIGNAIANYFIYRMRTNFSQAFKDFKNFVCTANDYPLKEIIDNYLDVNIMKDKINVFTKSYHNR